MGRLKNLVRTKPKELAGTGFEVLLATVSDLTNNPKTVEELAGSGYVYALGDGVKIGEAFTYKMSAGQTPAPIGGFIKSRLYEDSGEVMTESIGERGFEAFKNSAKGYIVGMQDAVRDWMQKANEEGCVLLITMRDSKDFAVIGSIDYPIYLKFKGGSGAKAGDKIGVDFTLEDNEGHIFRTYPKTLALNMLTI